MDPKRLSQMLGFPIAQPDATVVKKPKFQPNADSVEKRIRGERQPEDAMTRYGDPKMQGKVGKPNTLEDDLGQADINLNKKLRK